MGLEGYLAERGWHIRNQSFLRITRVMDCKFIEINKNDHLLEVKDRNPPQ